VKAVQVEYQCDGADCPNIEGVDAEHIAPKTIFPTIVTFSVRTKDGTYEELLNADLCPQCRRLLLNKLRATLVGTLKKGARP
jgi:hypothetical protein